MKCILGTAFIMVIPSQFGKSISSGIIIAPLFFSTDLQLVLPLSLNALRTKVCMDSRRHLFDLSQIPSSLVRRCIIE